MAPDIAALKLKHAEHILQVVRGAEKQEAVRQRKLRHATSKANLAYLQKRSACVHTSDPGAALSYLIWITAVYEVAASETRTHDDAAKPQPIR